MNVLKLAMLYKKDSERIYKNLMIETYYSEHTPILQSEDALGQRLSCNSHWI